MMNRIYEIDKEFTIRHIKKYLIPYIHPEQFKAYVAQAIIIKDSSFVEPLLKVIAKGAYKEHIYIATEALSSYNDIEVNRMILDVKRENRILNKKHYGKEYDKLLTEYGLL